MLFLQRVAFIGRKVDKGKMDFVAAIALLSTIIDELDYLRMIDDDLFHANVRAANAYGVVVDRDCKETQTKEVHCRTFEELQSALTEAFQQAANATGKLLARDAVVEATGLFQQRVQDLTMEVERLKKLAITQQAFEVAG
eukprot:TRINITY_DN30959_c0_g1_i1.p2 TRINITY_DN30959_c0_g1~~TRINITY_DN30959_c0_g1_i1.p2  ORF type:complete len:140 (+),score=36.05 TRINITY_DN30959_c0_g1_i1:135-554(+)